MLKVDPLEQKQRSFLFVFSNENNKLGSALVTSASSQPSDEKYEAARKLLLEELRRTGV